MAKKKQDTPISPEAIAALRASVFDGNAFVLTEDNLPCYAEVKALVLALGGRWVPGRKRHEFHQGVDARQLIVSACDRGVIPASNPNDFFPTPAPIVNKMVTEPWMAERINSRLTVADLGERPVRFLEPNGGSGSLVKALVALMRPQDELVIVELNPLLAANLRSSFPQATVIEADFLTYHPDQSFDVILMNPPFAGKTYAMHIHHAFGMLAKQGVLASVVPSMFLDHGDEFLFMVAEAGYWEHLGGDLFDGTATSTSIIWMENDFANKWREKPVEGFRTQHAWNIAVSIGSDFVWLTRLRHSSSFEQAESILAEWVREQVRDMHAVRCDESIAEDALRALVADYEHPELAHLLPKHPEPVGQLEMLVC